MRVKFFVVGFLLLFSASLRADILVIVNAKNPLQEIDHKQVVDLFMGRVTAFPSGRPVDTLDLPSGTPLRQRFYRALTGKSEAQVDAYWATLIFAGRMSPPKQYANQKALVNAVAKNPSAIAYVSDTATLPPSVKAIMTLRTDE